MNFRKTKNLKTDKTFYFIDSNRTTKSNYDYQEILCRMKGMSYNTSWGYTRNNLQTSVFDYN